MQDKFIETAKQYLTLHPEYKQNFEQLVFRLKLIGVPENKIQNVLNELTKDTAMQYPKTASPRKSYGKLLVILYLIALSAMLFFILFSSRIKQPQKVISYVIPSPNTQTKPFLPSIPTNGIIKQVYASTLPVNMQQVFSYPVRNVQIVSSLRPKKEVIGFIPYWDMDVLDKLNLSELTTASLFGIEPDAEGNIIITDSNGQSDGGWTMWNDPRLPAFILKLQKRQIKVVLTVKSFSNSNMDQLLASTDAQKKLISNIVYMVSSKNLDGVNIDFEYTGAASNNLRNEFTIFITSLSTALKNEFPKASLTVDTYASSGVKDDLFDLPALALSIDSFVVMGYDFHTPYTGPGPVSPLTGEKSITSYLANYLRKVPSDKVILAVPYYGYDWELNGSSPNSTSILSYADILGLIGGHEINWSSVSETPWYAYTDSQGNQHQVYFDNIRSLGLKYDLVNQMQLKGIAIWALGYEGEHTGLDQLIAQKFAY
ncbi:glycosyl hydrolase family 18 protein [Patescibacteria group bacterium]|nr:glycosyl hydrolase family 18 protein [Patescibacteria group bacterium]